MAQRLLLALRWPVFAPLAVPVGGPGLDYNRIELNDGILELAEVHFASGRRTVVSSARVVNGARIVNGAEKKALDRGGNVWPPRSNAADDRF